MAIKLYCQGICMFAPRPVGTVDVGWIAAAFHVDKERRLVGLVWVAFQPCQLPLPMRCRLRLSQVPRPTFFKSGGDPV